VAALDDTNGASLDDARKDIGLTLEELWMKYFELGGSADPLELEGILTGILMTDPYQYNIVAHALNEQFSDAGRDHPVPYQ